MTWFVYMLRCADNSLYCGSTNNLEKRTKKHQEGKGAKYTRSRLPVSIVWSERCKSKSDALKREYQIKQLDKKSKESLVKDQQA